MEDIFSGGQFYHIKLVRSFLESSGFVLRPDRYQDNENDPLRPDGFLLMTKRPTDDRRRSFFGLGSKKGPEPRAEVVCAVEVCFRDNTDEIATMTITSYGGAKNLEISNTLADYYRFALPRDEERVIEVVQPVNQETDYEILHWDDVHTY